MKILAIDLGKYNSVACLFNTTTNQSEFETIATQRWALEQLLNQTKPGQIVIETSSITGWVHDFCQSLGYQVLVANPSAEAWRSVSLLLPSTHKPPRHFEESHPDRPV